MAKHNILELANQRFGRLVAIEYSHSTKHERVWKCLCDCGKDHFVGASLLNKGRVRSCGCVMTTHGLTKSSTYKSWSGMRTRCESVTYRDYPLYGGRGIKICRRWRKFINFLADMGVKPTPQHTLDRINNNKGYSKANCRWATWKEQQRNRRNNSKYTYQGRTQLIMDWAKEYGLKRQTLERRLKIGMDFYKALTTPIGMRWMKITDSLESNTEIA